MNYILLTPVKNEEKNLQNLIDCITRQTILPKIWVIVDGNSKDGTTQIIKCAESKFDWIYLKNQKSFSNNENHMNFAFAVKEGYEFAQQISIKKKINYDYVGKIDADVILPKNFFEKLITYLELDPQLGAVSGISYTLKDENIKKYIETMNEFSNLDVKSKDNLLIDELPDKRLYRRESLDKIGGFQLTKFSPDTVILVKLRLLGLKTICFQDIKMYNIRRDSTMGKNLWAGYKNYGKSKYYLNYHPLLIFCSILNTFTIKPYYQGFAYILGYFESFINHEEKIKDKEIREYFWKKRLREIIHIIRKRYTNI